MRSLVACAASVLLAAVALATTKLVRPIEEYAAGAEHVALVRLESEEAVCAGYLWRYACCGFLYQATVVESLKGDATQISFYSPKQVSVPRTAVVLVNRLTDEGREFLESRQSLFSPKRSAHLQCEIEHGQLFAKDHLVVELSEENDSFVARQYNPPVAWPELRARLVRALSR